MHRTKLIQRNLSALHAADLRSSQSRIKSFLRNNGLTIVFLLLFLLALIGQAIAGLLTLNEERATRHEPKMQLVEYLRSGDFWSATGENWESEFLQMFCFVWMSVFLYQKGSPESNNPDGLDDKPVSANGSRRHRQPWPVRHGGCVYKLYSHSLSLAFLLLFVISFFIHAANGARHFSEERARSGLPSVSTIGYLSNSRMWFESLQNWQSEFLSVASMVFLAVYLRERGSPESKRVEAAHSEHH